jgi:CheY-like chemotaxis protein
MTRILVVDDDPRSRATVETILKRNGYAVVLAECSHHGAAAIEAFAFDVAIVDVFMPGMGGLETIRLFHASAPALPIIVMSGYAFRDAGGPDFVRMAIDQGATVCLHKPFTAAELLMAVGKCNPVRSYKAVRLPTWGGQPVASIRAGLMPR